LRCEESPRFRYALRVAAGTHWSEDTLGLPRMNLARCVLTPRSSNGVCRVNFPLSTYSVLGKKNVSQKKENTFEGLKGLYIVRRTGQTRCLPDPKSGFQGNLGNSTVKSLRQTSEFGEQALESLADGIRRGSVEVREFLSVGSIQFEINQEI
jgi:hypothetical protein